MNSILSTCGVNDVIAVQYGKTTDERVCRVIEVRDLITHPLSASTIARRPNVDRGNRLVTCQATDGKIRAFYAGVENTAREIPKLRAAFLYLRGKLPARKRVLT